VSIVNVLLWSTYESHINGARSLIDHVVVNQNMKDYLTEFYTVDDIDNKSDHISVVANINISVEHFACTKKKHEPKVAWYKASMDDIKKYKVEIDNAIRTMNIPESALKCINVNCVDHQNEIEQYCVDLLKVCLNVGKCVLPSVGNTGEKPKSKQPLAGWDEYVADKKEIALLFHWLWKDAGKPRNGYLAHERRRTRAQYHYAICTLKKYQDALKSESMAQSMTNGNMRDFWKETKKMKGSNKKLPTTVDGVTGDENIAQVFLNKFEGLYNSVGYNNNNMEKIKQTVINKLTNESESLITDSLFSLDDFKCAIKHIHKNKFDGSLGMFSDHIIYGTDKLWQCLVRLYNAMTVHGVTPTELLCGTLIPIPKNRRANICISDNFRAVCLQSVLCKIMDIMILQRESTNLKTSDLQFGFKKGLSAALATSTVLSTIDYYVNRGGRVYTLALDATKAFDRVQYDKLFAMLIERGVNPLYIRLLLNMYCNQKLRVSFNGSNSSWFGVANGVKQGGVLSPTLFGIYIDGMLKDLEASGYGCYVGEVYCGVVAYADDQQLLAPTGYSLRKMVKVCERYASKYNIKFNGSKSLLMCCGKGNMPPRILVNGEVVPTVDKMSHLGNVMVCDNNDFLIDNIVRDFNIKVNHFLTDFGRVTSRVKNILFKQHCASLYGVQNCIMSDLEEMCVAWRKAVRRVWQVPYRTHNRYIPHLSQTFPIGVIISKRFIKHFISGFQNDNNTVQFIFQNSINARSRLGSNIRYVCEEYGLDVYKIGHLEFSDVCNRMIGEWKKGVMEDDVRVCEQIIEMCELRDTCIMNPWLLERNEIEDIIEYLCIA